MEEKISGGLPHFVFRQNQASRESQPQAEIGTASWALEALLQRGGKATFREVKLYFRAARKTPEKAEESFRAACEEGCVSLYKVQNGRGRPRYEFRINK